jgi:hypothetical protein
MRFMTANDRELWAGVDPDTHHLEGRACETRFGAFLAPFKTEEEAAAALLDAGGVLDVIQPPKRPGRQS